VLEPKWNDRKSMWHCLHSVCICHMQIPPKNITNSQANDLLTPKPAKLDKHIHLPREGHCSMATIFLSTHATCPVYYRSHTPICVGSVTGIFYHSGIAQEYLCFLTSPNSPGDSRLQRLSKVEFPLATSPEAYSKCSTT
jgi:hypothetical protein